MEATTSSGLGQKLQEAGTKVWAWRVPLAIILAAAGGMLWVTWYQSPEKQLEGLGEQLLIAGNDKDVDKLLRLTVGNLQDELRTKGSQAMPVVVDMPYASCMGTCRLIWSIGVYSHEEQSSKRTGSVEVEVVARLDPVPGDGRPRLWPVGYTWMDGPVTWSIARRKGEGPAAVTRGNYDDKRPETVNGAEGQAAVLAGAMGQHMMQTIMAANEKNR